MKRKVLKTMDSQSKIQKNHKHQTSHRNNPKDKKTTKMEIKKMIKMEKATRKTGKRLFQQKTSETF